ncbi:MAG TPA: hypothetical protein VM509_07830, partial [Planctomycetota bacterium]|nr:hypothetical protein [Planctomycetota bacterium]
MGATQRAESNGWRLARVEFVSDLGVGPAERICAQASGAALGRGFVRASSCIVLLEPDLIEQRPEQHRGADSATVADAGKASVSSLDDRRPRQVGSSNSRV